MLQGVILCQRRYCAANITMPLIMLCCQRCCATGGTKKSIYRTGSGWVGVLDMSSLTPLFPLDQL